jgi:hypothetical protein
VVVRSIESLRQHSNADITNNSQCDRGPGHDAEYRA